MRLRIFGLLIGFCVISLLLTATNSYSVDKKSRNMSQIAEKINELKSIENIINKKIEKLNKEKKEIEKEKNEIIKLKKETDAYVADAKKRLESIKKQIADEKIKKLSAIYSQAKAQSAADALSNMDENLAAQILIFMQARKSGAIISKMNPKKASSIFQKFVKSSTIKKTTNKQ